MKKASLILMACLMLVGPVFARGEGSPGVRIETINFTPTNEGLDIQLEAQATKLTSATLNSAGEILRVQMNAPGMVLFDECGGYVEEFPEFDVQIDTTDGLNGISLGKVRLSTFTGQGTLVRVTRYSYNGDQSGELCVPLEAIKSVTLLYNGRAMAKATF